MNLTKEIKKQAIKAGFACVGITSPEMLRGLPHGWIGNVINLRSPEEELEKVNSVILLGYFAWDKSFNLAVDSTYLKHRNDCTPKVPLERYQLYYEVLKKQSLENRRLPHQERLRGVPLALHPSEDSGCQVRAWKPGEEYSLNNS